MGRPEPPPPPQLPPSRTQRRKRRILPLTITGIVFTVFLVFLLCRARCYDYLSIDVAPSMAYDSHVRPKPDLTSPTLVASLPSSALPQPHGGPDSPRLIVIGDVHGQLDALDALLKKAGYSRARGDHVLFTGDMVNKGPDSGGVVDRAVEIGAWGVRGNHEDRVLKAWDEMVEKGDTEATADTEELESEKEEAEEEEEEIDAEGKKKKKNKGKHKHKKYKSSARDRATAASLTPAQRTWLARLPVILHVGVVSPYYGDVVVVHAGLIPGVPLEKQDAWAVMNMRTLLRDSSLDSASPDSLLDSFPKLSLDTTSHHHRLKPSEGREGRPWSAVWNEAQKALRKHGQQPTTVVYGHDAKTGLSIRRYAFGLDTGCVRGGKLTALVFEPTAAPDPGVGDDEEYEEEHDDDGDNDGEEAENGDEEATTTKKKKNKNKHKHKQAKYGITHRLVSVSCEPGDGKGRGHDKKKDKDRDKSKGE